ncbi:efflux RND transporter periplasmic adaptor subunit [Ideonella sp.]|uniref:efflux RND transporter periplasmic adaptor subunit n=1 Tax=Ideonella sp. TaxID=1929293 RepID=UPI003BB67B79
MTFGSRSATQRKWLLGLATLMLVSLGAYLVLRKPGPAAPAPAASTAAPSLQLTPADVLTVKRLPLTRQVELSGALKAVNSAFVKAKVAGELQQLSVREGSAVQAGQTLGQIDPAELDLKVKQAEQQAESARAQWAVAERSLANNRALVTQGFISATALDTTQANANGAQANLQAALAAVDLARKARQDSVLRAPLSGLIAQRLAQPGERVALDARILEIVDLSQLELEASVAPGELSQVTVGTAARLQVEGWSEPVAAKVVRINPSAQTGSRNLLVYLSVAPHPALRQGLFATGHLLLPERSALVIPLGALRVDQPAPYVVALEGGRAVHRKVSLGARGVVAGEPMVEILAGLKDGDALLAQRTGTIRDGLAVTLPATNPAPQPASAASR